MSEVNVVRLTAAIGAGTACSAYAFALLSVAGLVDTRRFACYPPLMPRLCQLSGRQAATDRVRGADGRSRNALRVLLGVT